MSCNICPICATSIVLDIACNTNFFYIIIDFCNVTLLCIRFAYCALSFAMFINGACLYPGDAFFLGDAFLLGDAFYLGDALHYFKRRKIKAKNYGTSFSQTGFTFYLGDLIKKPPRGKKSVPFN